MRRTILAGIALGLSAALGVTVPAHAQPLSHHRPAPAVVRVLHAVPDLNVDVYVGSTRVLNDFTPGSLSAALKVAPGKYLVRVTASTATSPRHPLLAARLRFASHGDYTVAAHLKAGGAPTLTKYRNDTRPVAGHKGRITVRHVAAAPAVDILVNGAVAMRHLRNPHESRAVLHTGTYGVAVALAGTTTPVIGPAAVPIQKRTNTIVYAWGSAKAGNLTVAVQQVALR